MPSAQSTTEASACRYCYRNIVQPCQTVADLKLAAQSDLQCRRHWQERGGIEAEHNPTGAGP